MKETVKSSLGIILIFLCGFLVSHLSEKSKRANLINTVQTEIYNLNELNRNKIEELKGNQAILLNSIEEIDREYEEIINGITSDFNSRLQQSEKRASLYLQKAKTGEAACEDIAVYTAKLDRAIVEGRELVRELTETIRYRDNELALVGKYFLEEREFLND